MLPQERDEGRQGPSGWQAIPGKRSRFWRSSPVHSTGRNSRKPIDEAVPGDEQLRQFLVVQPRQRQSCVVWCGVQAADDIQRTLEQSHIVSCCILWRGCVLRFNAETTYNVTPESWGPIDGVSRWATCRGQRIDLEETCRGGDDAMARQDCELKPQKLNPHAGPETEVMPRAHAHEST